MLCLGKRPSGVDMSNLTDHFALLAASTLACDHKRSVMPDQPAVMETADLYTGQPSIDLRTGCRLRSIDERTNLLEIARQF